MMMIEIKQKPDLKDYLIAFEKIKAMPNLGQLIEAYKKKSKKENANIVSQYVNDEAKEQKLIEELRTIQISCNSNEQLSFIPEYLFSIVKDMAQDYRKIRIASEVAGNFLKEAKVQGGYDMGLNLCEYLGDQDITTLALVNKKTYKELEPLNKLLTRLQEICKGSSTLINEPELEQHSRSALIK